jgi:hypothetical protein
MARESLLVLIGLLGACAQDQPPALVGTWALPLNSSCNRGLSFDEDGTWVESRACVGPSGDVDVERHEGTYIASETTLTATIARSSCTTVPIATKRASYAVDGNLLQLTGDFPIIYFRTEPAARQTDAGTVRLGCFDGPHVFVAHAVADLPQR